MLFSRRARILEEIQLRHAEIAQRDELEGIVTELRKARAAARISVTSACTARYLAERYDHAQREWSTTASRLRSVRAELSGAR